MASSAYQVPRVCGLVPCWGWYLLGMRLRVQVLQLKLDDDGVGEVELPAEDPRSMHRHLRSERLNARAHELYVTDILWTDEDEAENMAEAMESFLADEDIG